MKKLSILLVLYFLFFASSCVTTYPVLCDIEEGVNFSRYQTYYILNDPDGFPVGASPIHRQRIERAISLELNAMGMNPDMQPDLAISWEVNMKEENLTKWNYEFFGEWNSISNLENTKLLNAILSIDFIDVKNRKVIWHGKISQPVYEGMPKMEEKINAAVNAIFKKYQTNSKYGESMVFVK